MDCSPHISLFLSTAMQTPGLWALVTTVVLHLSFDVAIEENIFKRMGAFCEISLRCIFQWNEEHLVASILWNGERGFVSWQIRKHSELILWTTQSNTISHRSLWFIIASATKGKWLPARALPMALADSLSVEVVVEPDRAVTVTYGTGAGKRC